MARKNAPSNRPPRTSAPAPVTDGRPPMQLHLVNRQRAHRLNMPRIRRIAQAALPLCLAETGPLPADLPNLREVDVSLISAAAMSRVHVDFLGLEGPTDVITFPYGEILVCPAIAAGNAERYGVSLDDEVALYVIHGLLHLNGYDDLTPAHARQMRARQAKILNAARKSE